MITVNFSPVVSSLEQLRGIFDSRGKDFWGEYCYHMISVMLESEKVLSGENFSPRYIAEHCNYMASYAKEIAREEERSLDR